MKNAVPLPGSFIHKWVCTYDYLGPRVPARPTGADFSLLASACRGHLVGVCLHGVSVHAVALAVVVLTVFFFPARPVGTCVAQARPAKVAHAEAHVKALDTDAES